MLDGSGEKVARGTILVITARGLGILLGFAIGPVMTRYITVEEYGLFSLAGTILGIAVQVSTLGLQQGLTRQVAFHLGVENKNFSGHIFSQACLLAVPTCVFLCLLLLGLSPWMAVYIFNKPALSPLVRIFSMALPFAALNEILISVFRGYGFIEIPSFIQNVRNSFFLVFLLLTVCLQLNAEAVVWSQVAADFVTCSGLFWYTANRLRLSFTGDLRLTPQGRELLALSLPLLGVGLLHSSMSWATPLMLGAMKSPADVALYQIAYSLSLFVYLVRDAMAIPYLPVVSRLYVAGTAGEVRWIYALATRWQMILSLPVFLLLYCYGDFIICTLYGTVYRPSWTALQFLSLGSMVQIALGPSGMNLTATGKTVLLFRISAASLAVLVLTNILLIPKFGFVGASISISIILGLTQLVYTLMLFQTSGLHPFTWNCLKHVAIAIFLAFAGGFFRKAIPWPVSVNIFLLMLSYIFLILIFKVIGKDDLAMLCQFQKGPGLTALGRFASIIWKIK